MEKPFEQEGGREGLDQRIGQIVSAERGTTPTEIKWSGIRALYRRYGQTVAQEWSKDINF
ncbi:MAG: hypothetical protein PHV78_01300 [Patescibacteria group bacterium]|nr:hypothetical protein [Patescibacteria group bacterium]MDD5121207.1 hypothetical protein [Patescibacteria group bacterium]MDD5221764.1 hypothetical protein [Patescibacteria group bacterium]MDD5395874.1 hypothetical protein [Patescibacteria group bacterium]